MKMGRGLNVFQARGRPSACFKYNEMRSGDGGDELVENEFSLGSFFLWAKEETTHESSSFGANEKRRFVFSSL